MVKFITKTGLLHCLVTTGWATPDRPSGNKPKLWQEQTNVCYTILVTDISSFNSMYQEHTSNKHIFNIKSNKNASILFNYLVFQNHSRLGWWYNWGMILTSWVPFLLPKQQTQHRGDLKALRSTVEIYHQSSSITHLPTLEERDVAWHHYQNSNSNFLHIISYHSDL